MSEQEKMTVPGFEGDSPELTQQRDVTLRLADRLEQVWRRYEKEVEAIPPCEPVRVGEIQLPKGCDVATLLALDITVERDQHKDIIETIRKTATQDRAKLEEFAVWVHRDDLDEAAKSLH